MIFSSTAEYFAKFVRVKSVNAKAEESEAWEDSSSDASNYSEETTGLVEDITVISEPIAILAN